VFDVAEAVERLDREADAVRGQAAHFSEQEQEQTAALYLQIEYGLRRVAHVLAAVHGEDE
jgi:hypothetical protein